jgi:flagellar basal body-associated protein FliL
VCLLLLLLLLLVVVLVLLVLLLHAAVYESHKFAASSQQQQLPAYLSLTQTIRAPMQQQQQQQVLPVCLGPDELSRALEAGINEAFHGQLSQSSAVDTTYVQVCVCMCVRM